MRRYIYGPSASTSVTCSGFYAYDVDIGVSETALSFRDDRCGALSLADVHGSSDVLYVYVRHTLGIRRTNVATPKATSGALPAR